MNSAAEPCGHRCPQHPAWIPCQRPPRHPDEGGHQAADPDGNPHAWTGDGHTDVAAMLYAAAEAWNADAVTPGAAGGS